MRRKFDLSTRTSLVILLVYIIFIVYGSLVPLDFVSMPFDRALSIFKSIRMLELGVESRADWVANGVLYFPLGFLGVYCFSRVLYNRLLGVSGITILLAMTLAVSIEFAQIFFPPRTVSLNDLLAETLGAVSGVLIAPIFFGWFNRAANFRTIKIDQLVILILQCYIFFYVAFSLFPFDFLISSIEIDQKLASSQLGWLLADTTHGVLLTAIKLGFEILAFIPVGILIRISSNGKTDGLVRLVLFGALLGGAIEVAQLFMASGVTEGASVISRAIGIFGGYTLWKYKLYISRFRLNSFVRQYGIILICVYFLLLLEVNGIFTQKWMGADFAIDQFQKLRFMPFYYHYFTSEAKALFSLVAVCLMYSPVGVLSLVYRSTLGQALVRVFFLAVFVEFAKLFLLGSHPDPSNIILGLIVTWSIFYISKTFIQVANSSQAISLSLAGGDDSCCDLINTAPVKGLRGFNNNPAIAIALPVIALVLYEVLYFPIQPVLFAIVLCIYALIIWKNPAVVVAALPAALPILDLAPWSGRFFLDEFDLLVMLSLAIGYIRIPPASRSHWGSNKPLVLIGGLVALTYFISTLNCLVPWPAIDENSFTNYFSPFNSLRITKGALWAFLIFGLMHRMVALDIDVKRTFSMGMVFGLAWVTSAIVWERLAFSGLFNFSGDYRVTGPFSSMHTGGAYIECFLAVATPFLVLLVVRATNRISKLSGTALLLAATYCLMVTFSRNGYFAFGVSLTIILFFSVFKSSARIQRPGLLVVLLTLAMLSVAIPIFTGQFAQKRIATVAADLKVRQAHWSDALDIRKSDLSTAFVGMGVGRYPESHYLFSREGNRSGTYQVVSGAANDFLRLGSGDSIYIEQMVDLEPRQKYIIKFDVRTDQPNGKIHIPICEKWMLTSFNCIWNWTIIGTDAGVWHHFELPIQTDRLNIGSWYSPRTTKLALFNGNPKGVVDIDNVVLENGHGQNLLENGDFSRSMDHWYFVADSHLQWHIKSLPVAILFDQGWLGLVALGLFSLLGIGVAARKAWLGDLDSGAFLAAFCGFLVVGLFDTLIDAPRFLLLFLLLGYFCSINSPPAGKERAI